MLTHTSQPIPIHYLLLLYPCHQLLDSAGPLDILSTATKNQTRAAKDITLTIAAETLSPVPVAPYSPSSAPWTFEPVPDLTAASDKSMVGYDFDIPLQPHITFTDLVHQLQTTGGTYTYTTLSGQHVTKTVDVLLIPGGFGVRMFRIDKSTGARTSNIAPAMEATTSIMAWTRSAVLTVCTGSDLLARTGVLNGRRACTNVVAFPSVSKNNPGVQWLEYRRFVRSLPEEQGRQNVDSDVTNRRVTQSTNEVVCESSATSLDAEGQMMFHREVWTGAGISAGMDLMLWFMAEVYGFDFAKDVSRRLEYEWHDYVKEGEVDKFYVGQEI